MSWVPSTVFDLGLQGYVVPTHSRSREETFHGMGLAQTLPRCLLQTRLRIGC